MITLDAQFNKFSIPYPRKRSEFEAHAYLLVRLQERGFDARANVLAPAKFSDSRKNVCTFDIVIFKGQVPQSIIEIKAAPVKHRNGVEATRQGHRYRFFGVPVTFVYGREDADRFLAAI